MNGEEKEEKKARERLTVLHHELVRNDLVAWTSGNVSERLGGNGRFLIKPSGVDYDDLTPESMVLCELNGGVVPGSVGSERNPSSDTAAHAYIYRQMPHVKGVVHTHSSYATAWAAVGRPIPCVLTAMADEFGGEIPIGPFATIGDESIGQGVVDTLVGHRSKAVLMQNHGVFTVGSSARDAVKAAVMCEDVAKTVHRAMQLGEPLAIEPKAIDALFDRYQNIYGQSSKEMPQ